VKENTFERKSGKRSFRVSPCLINISGTKLSVMSVTAS